MHHAPSRRRRPHVAGTANHAWLLGCLFVVLLLCVRGEDGVCAGAAGGREVRVAFVGLDCGGADERVGGGGGRSPADLDSPAPPPLVVGARVCSVRVDVRPSESSLALS